MIIKNISPFLVAWTMLSCTWLTTGLFAISNMVCHTKAGERSMEPLVEVRKINSHIRVMASHGYLRKTVALHLDMAQRELEQLGLGLKIMGAYRPLSAQKKLWQESPDNRYVANPKNGSRHNRGAAVDLRLVRLNDGKELTMPVTSFSRACHRNYEGMQSEDMKKNCKLLELMMEKHGFIPLPTEWWHFDYKDWADYDLLDIAINDLEKNDDAETLIEQNPIVMKKPGHKKKRGAPKKRRKKVRKKKLTIAPPYNKVQEEN